MGSDRLYREVICRLTMSEGRQSQVVLLDDRRLDMLIKPKLYAGELLDMVASHFSLKEKEYFGLAYVDDTGHYSWLQLDRRVLEHEFPKKSAQTTLVLYFRIKYFVESITQLRDSSTVEAFYLQTQSLIYNGIVDVCSEKAFQLAALVLQATHGDYSSDTLARQQLKKLPVLPTSALIDHPSLSVCEERVFDNYRSLQGQSRGSAIVNYMRIAESLPTYGSHYYEVKDKAGIPWWLGISWKGICQYDLTDRKVPRKLFLWKQLENLYFRDRKFSIEVTDPKRTNASGGTFGSGNISVFVWFANSPSLTKCIWSMAISQHQFYLDRKHNKGVQTPSRNFSDIADALSHGSYSTETSSLGRSVSSLSLPALKLDSDSCDETLDTTEMFVALKARKEALEKVLRKKCEELKKICLREGELTGALPPEMPLSPGEQIPIIKKKVGAPIRDRIFWKKRTKDEEEYARLELEYEIQTKIVSAAFKLLNDHSLKKNIRRQRKISYQKAMSKLKEIEQKLVLYKKKEYHSSDDILQSNQPNDQFVPTSANLTSFPITFSPTEGKKEGAKNISNKMPTSKSSPVPLPSILRANSNSVPSSPSNHRHLQSKQRSSISDKQLILRPDLQGYTPSSIYQTQTSYRSQQYPTFSMRSPTSCSSPPNSEYGVVAVDKESGLTPLTAPYRNKFESTLDLDNSNLYSVPTQRTSQAFDTQDDITTSSTPPPQDLGLVSRHNSLDRNRRHSQKYRKYIESGAFSNSLQRPGSTQQPAYKGVPYQEQQSPYHHHPHYFHHHPHQGVKSPTQELKSAPPTVPPQDSNLYQKNLTLCAPDAMFVGKGRHSPKPQTYHTSPVSDKYHWSELPVPKSNSRTHSPSFLSPPGTLDRSWSKTHQGVHASVSVDSLKSHLTSPGHHITSPGHLPPNVDVVTYGHFQPSREETKPYETSDFYKYSTKHRKQHQVASQNLQAKLLAWKASQTSAAQFHTTPAPPVMSPVLERSRTASPACAVPLKGQPQAHFGENGTSSNKLKTEDCPSSQPKEPKDRTASSDAFHDELLEWITKQEKGKKTTLV